MAGSSILPVLSTSIRVGTMFWQYLRVFEKAEVFGSSSEERSTQITSTSEICLGRVSWAPGSVRRGE